LADFQNFFHWRILSVAKELRCGGMFSRLTTLLQIFHRMCQWKKFQKSINTWQWYGQKFVAYFLGHPVYRRWYRPGPM